MLVSRWLLPVMGLAGVEGEIIQPLVRMTPAMITILAASVAGIVFLLRRQARSGYPQAKRLVDEAEQWSDEFLIGHDAQGVPVSRRRGLISITAGESPALLYPSEPETEPAGDGLRDGLAGVAFKLEPEQVVAGRPAVALTGAVPAAAPPRVTARLKVDPFEDFGDLGSSHGFAGKLSQRPENPGLDLLHQLPPPLPEFAGRSFELAELFAARSNPEIKILGLQGLGGVGKTTLAVRLANQLAPHYPDAQIYIDLKGSRPLPLPIAEAQAQIIRAFLPTARLPENEADLSLLYRHVLRGKRVLLLLDNAVNAQQAAPLLPPENCLSIVTSRQYIALPGLFASRIDSLSHSEARELIVRIVPQIGDQADLIADLCGRLPLALRLAASTLTQHPDLSVEDYALKLNQLHNREKPPRPIEAVLATSFDLLNPNLQKLWRSLAAFSDTFDINAAAAVWRINPDRAGVALDLLMAYSLVERNRATGRFRLHDLMSHFADTHLAEEERIAAKHRYSAHYQSVLHEADALYEQGGKYLKQGLDLVDLEWHNIQAGQVWAATRPVEDRAACELCNSYPDAGKYVLDLRQHPRERIRWSEAALNAAKMLRRRKAAGRHLIALGDSYLDMSEVNHGIGFYEQALELSRSINDRRGEADALIGLGSANYIGGALVEARQNHEEALEISRLIKDQRVEAIALGNLGVTHFALGEPRTSTVLFDQQLRIAREIGDRRNESVALGGLGAAYYALGEARRSIRLLNQQLAITREIGDRRGEASALSNLGGAYASLGDHQQAIELHEHALSIAREIVDRRNEANALGGLGVDYYLRGDIDVAAQFLDQQLNLASEIGDRRSQSQALINLGEAVSAAGDLDRAIDLLQQAFEITSQTGDIQGQGNALFNLALVFDKQGDREQAVVHAETALKLFEAADHPQARSVKLQLDQWE